MNKIKFGFQTYTWQMSYEKYKHKTMHILDIIEKTGIKGVEFETCMMSKYYDDSQLFKNELDKRGVEFAAMTLVLDWENEKETDEEYSEAQKCIEYLKIFPETKLALVQMPGKDRSNLKQRQKNVINCLNAVAKRAADKGIICTCHPNSPASSLFRIGDDYEVLMNGIDKSVIGFTPDTGHIANGGMDPMSIFKKYRDVINHVHFKDYDEFGQWQAMGEGMIDHTGIVKFLKDTGYGGWIMVEEESENAKTDPDGVTSKNAVYMKEQLLTI